MPDVIAIIGVIPGVVGLWAYKRRLYTTLPQPEGWAYLFAVVIFAAPSYYIFEISPISPSLGGCLSTESACSVGKFFGQLVYSISLTFLFGTVAAIFSNINLVSRDPFHGCCYLWKGQPVFITLKNSTVYLAILLDYTKDLRFESTIRIVPICSGYKNEHGKIKWTFVYPQEYLDKKKRKSKISTVIFQKEMISFSLWDESITSIGTIKP